LIYREGHAAIFVTGMALAEPIAGNEGGGLKHSAEKLFLQMWLGSYCFRVGQTQWRNAPGEGAGPGSGGLALPADHGSLQSGAHVAADPDGRAGKLGQKCVRMPIEQPPETIQQQESAAKTCARREKINTAKSNARKARVFPQPV
jgi:hypothetical protein